MSNIIFTWDEKKNNSNINKHGISFDEAESVFFDDNARIIYDPDSSEDEDRFIILGLNRFLKILVVAHCYKENDSIIRIFSARKANKKEINYYMERLK